MNRVDLVDEDDIPKETLRKINAYTEGFQSGLNWPDAWEGQTPGGPYVYTSYGCSPSCRGCERQTSPHWNCRQQKEEAANSQERNTFWRKGWSDGHGEKIKTKRSNPIPQRTG